MSVWYIATGGGGERIEGEEAKELDRLKKELVYQQALKHVVGVPLDILLTSLEVNVRDIRTNTVVHFYFDDHLKYYVLQTTKGPKYEFVNMDENGTILSIEPAITAAIKAEEKLRIEENLNREGNLIIKENAGIISRESWETFAMVMASGLFASVGAAGAWKLYKQRRFIDI
jgi:hypothetical protein